MCGCILYRWPIWTTPPRSSRSGPDVQCENGQPPFWSPGFKLQFSKFELHPFPRPPAERKIRLVPFNRSCQLRQSAVTTFSAIREFPLDSLRLDTFIQHRHYLCDLRPFFPALNMAQQAGPFAQTLHTGALQRGDVKKGVKTPILGDDKSKTLLNMEPFQSYLYDSFGHLDCFPAVPPQDGDMSYGITNGGNLL